MSEQTGALAGLRADRSLDELRWLVKERVGAQTDWCAAPDSAELHAAAEEAQGRLNAALAEVEARLARLARFVRAHDAHEHAIADPGPSHVWIAILVELRAARDALAPEDLVPGGNGHQPR